MGDTVIIDISAKFTDNTSSGVAKAKSGLDAFQKSAEKAKKQADDLSKSKLDMSITAVDKASAIFGKVRDVASNIIRKPWQMTVSVIDKAMAPLRSLYNFAFSLKGLLTGIVVGKIGQSLVSEPVSLADQIQKSRIFFEKKLGSEEAANQMIQDIFKFDEKSPFDTMQITSMVQSMMGRGWTQENVLTDLGTIGDSVAAMGGDTDSVAAVVKQLGDMKLKPKLAGEELNILTGYGIPVMEYVAKGLGLLTDEMTEKEKAAALETTAALKEKGEIKGSDAVNYILEGMKEYEGSAAENADKTVSGILDQIKSYFTSKIALPWGEGLAEGLKQGLNAFKGLMDKYSDKFLEWGDLLKTTGAEISVAVADFFESNLLKIDNLVSSDAFQNASVGDKFKMLWEEIIANPIEDWWNSSGKTKIEGVVNNIFDFVSEKFSAFIGKLPELISTAASALYSNDVTGTLTTLFLGEKALGAVSGGLNLVSSGMKAAKTISSLFGGGAAAAGATAGAGGALSGVAGALAAIPGWGWAAAAAIAAVTVGAVAYNGYLEKQERLLLETGDRVREAMDAYQETTAELDKGETALKDYKDALAELEEVKKSSKSTDEELAAAQQTVTDKLKTLSDMFPEMFEKLDTEDAVRAIDYLMEKERQLSELRLRTTYNEEKDKLPELQETYREQTGIVTKSEKEIQSAQAIINDIDGLNTSAYRFNTVGLSDEEKKVVVDSMQLKVDEIKQIIGNDFADNDVLNSLINQFDPLQAFRTNEANSETGEGLNLGETFQTEIDSLMGLISGLSEQTYSTMEEAQGKADSALTSMQELFEMEKQILDLQYGSTLEEDFANVDSMNQTSKDAASEHLSAVNDLVQKYSEIPEVVTVRINQVLTSTGTNYYAGTGQNHGSSVLGIEQNASGNIIDKPTLSWVGEEYPESIIPLDPKRRGRAMDLWQQTGEMLGVKAYANGGVVGPSSSGSHSGGSGIVVEVGDMTFNFSGGGDAEGIMSIIKEKMPEIANEVANAIAVALSQIFGNMPVSAGGD